MKTHQATICVKTFIDAEQDATLIKYLKYDMSLSDEDEDFSTYLDEICEMSFTNHIVGRGKNFLWVKNRQDLNTIVAIVGHPEHCEDMPLRWTKQERRMIRKCYPHIAKWKPMLRVLGRKGRCWEEIENEAKRMFQIS